MTDDITATLQQKIEQLEEERLDLELSLSTAIEHGDFIEDQLSSSNTRLQQEIAERVHAENRLKKLVDLITRQKDDLEILVDTIVQHGDELDYRWLEQLNIVEDESLTDSLTGIANRRHFDRYLEREWKRAARNDTELSLLILDVDFFKEYNDSNGHIEGDRRLTEIAQLLLASLSRPADLVARYGGEEFAIVLPATPLQGATVLADDIRSRIEQARIPHPSSSIADHLTVSIGVACVRPVLDGNASSIVEQADQLLYKAKHSGRNCVISQTGSARSGKPSTETFGDFSNLYSRGRLESLNLSFFPSSVPVQQRWRNNGLSADFLADYLTTFFPDDLTSTRKTAEFRNGVSFIANELLENSMKYSAPDCTLPSGIKLYLTRTSVVFVSTNYADQQAISDLVDFIRKLESNDPMDLLMEQLEYNATHAQSTGLGYLTMINDYKAKIAWRLNHTDPNCSRVTVQVIVKIQDETDADH